MMVGKFDKMLLLFHQHGKTGSRPNLNKVHGNNSTVGATQFLGASTWTAGTSVATATSRVCLSRWTCDEGASEVVG